jgi:chromatin remodeling complex protein RSC6
LEEEFVELSRNVMEMSKSLKGFSMQLTKLYKKTLKLSKKAEKKKNDQEKRVGKNIVDLEKVGKLSQKASKFTGKKSMSKVDLVNAVHEYIRKNDLQNKDEDGDLRQVSCDDKLKEFVGVDEFSYMDVSKLLLKHVK